MRIRSSRALRGDRMKIAIIGAGNVESALARVTKAAGHEVVVTAKSKDKVGALATELDIGATASNLDAVEVCGGRDPRNSLYGHQRHGLEAARAHWVTVVLFVD
jgi:lactate dehydrogenase-like 2-hydroxyacid dehydrogenase